MGRPTDDRGAFRCSVAPENAAGKLKIGCQKIDVTVLDTSRSGFCVRMPSSFAAKLSEKQLPVLIHADEHWEVRVTSRYSEGNDSTNVGFCRVRELTKIKAPSSWGILFPRKADSTADPGFLFFLIFAFLASAVCLPGLGDRLGTAPKVRKAIHSVINKVY